MAADKKEMDQAKVKQGFVQTGGGIKHCKYMNPNKVHESLQKGSFK